jgi:hypothetical protein
VDIFACFRIRAFFIRLPADYYYAFHLDIRGFFKAGSKNTGKSGKKHHGIGKFLE